MSFMFVGLGATSGGGLGGSTGGGGGGGGMLLFLDTLRETFEGGT